MQWAGGPLGYTFAQRQERMNMPSLQGTVLNQDNQLEFDIRDQRNQKMVNLLLAPDLMLDVRLTQRFLLNVPSYNGQAGLDTYVISSRQPLLKGAS